MKRILIVAVIMAMLMSGCSMMMFNYGAGRNAVHGGGNARPGAPAKQCGQL